MTSQPCPRCSGTMYLEDDREDGDFTIRKIWVCQGTAERKGCGHEEPTAAVYRKEHGEA